MPSKTKNNFANPNITVDVVIFTIEDDHLQTLLIKRSNPPFENVAALPGGFLHKDETTALAARRILREKAGVSNVFVEQLYSFDDPLRDPRGPVISIAYFALVPKNSISIVQGSQVQTPEFAPIAKLPRLAFDHEKIIAYALRRLQSKLQYTNIVFSLLPERFTLSELQKTYEVVLERKLDKRNFQKKFLQLGLIQKTREMFKGKKQRPARLFEFISDRPEELKKFF